MNSIWPLVQNETIKIIKKKRFYVVLLVLLVLVPMFTYASMREAQENRSKFGDDWRVELQQAITDNQNSLGSDRVPEEWKKYRRIFIQQMQYYLQNDVNPNEPGGVTFTREFLDNSSSLFIPLLIMTIASDLVSGERTGGTIKMLLTRPVRRWKILLSKLITLTMFTSLIVISTFIICYGISGLVFGYSGFTMPVFTGFQPSDAGVNMDTVHAVDQWQFILMQMGLIWFVGLCVGLLAFMVSVLVRSTAASIVIMMAALIAGTILTNMASSWASAKYLFMVNLGLTNYLSGSPAPIDGMTLPFSLTVLAIWAAVSLVVSFAVFTKRDVLN
ncbi:ABC transporter permease [Paenibacillus hunanensis]|uniref:ABC-2 type transport system permease protein n=1 Tax=Paenibacillus hunanensis TaxID=539262 RepID=A0ABU1IXD7_9BACL|nr:ABC transporter permease [Paenibacillus hunanensis]MCL9662929.1 ABC transporter permease [Paenibacillus hunanensis]MDR6243042.1 ABC-2 type transport system permease protein [Paenibacillus hunanensis]WPP43194.1 ABC transporter permease [Paenibacillus hunanensis]GGJ12385.1 bacitracin ABC transporter permease [Paenibacillus hunanensis]